MFELITKLILDPRLFNYLILSLYAINIIRWAFERDYFNVWYWASAFSITACVTFAYKN